MIDQQPPLTPIAHIDELVLNILQFLTLHELTHTCCYVCSDWNHMIQYSELLWKIHTEELGWPKSLSLNYLKQQPSHLQNMLPKTPSSLLLKAQQQQQQQGLTWRKMYELLQSKTDLCLFVNSILMLPQCVCLLKEATGLDEQTIRRRMAGTPKGQIFVLKDEPLIDCLKMNWKLKSIDDSVLTELKVVQQDSVFYTLLSSPINYEVLEYTDEWEKMVREETANFLDSRFAVSILNDETHSFDEVERQLRIATGMPFEAANKITWKAHSNSECICFENDHLDPCFAVMKSLTSIKLGCRLRILKFDAMYNILKLYNMGMKQQEDEAVYKQQQQQQEHGGDNEGEQTPEEYCVLLSRDNNHSSQVMIEDYVRILSLSGDEALRLLFCVLSGLLFTVYQGPLSECQKIFDQFDKKLYNVVLKRAEQVKSMTSRNEQDIIQFDDEEEDEVEDDYGDFDEPEDEMGLTFEQERFLERLFPREIEQNDEYMSDDDDNTNEEGSDDDLD